MEININKALAAIEAYVLQPRPTLEKEILDSEANFKHFEAM